MSRLTAGIVGASAGIITGALVTVVLVTAVGVDESATDAYGLNEIAANGAIQGDLYPGAPTTEAQLVIVEDERLQYIRTIASVARWGDISTDGPYRLSTGPTFTLVLTAREAPYTIADLIELAPDTFIEQGMGTYLLSESIIVLDGAALALTSDADLTVRMASSGAGYTSIVSLGGALEIAGTANSVVTLQSWDAASGAVDTRTDDGRAYIRAIGGQATFAHAAFSDLGFWSGNTGGLALTGTDAVGSFDATGLDSVTTASAGSAAQPGTDEPIAEVAGALLLPSGALEAYATGVESNPFVSATIDDVSIDGNAFGLFVTSAVNVVVTGTSISNSLVDGLVFHRFVTDSSVTDTTSSFNAVDGFTLSRSSTGVTYSRVTASGNGRNGISIDGQSLADGPSAIGTGVASYGDNRVVDSVLTQNGRYGVEISGGRDVSVSTSRFDDNQVGVVVNLGASGPLITDNVFGEHAIQSVALRDGVVAAMVSGNTFEGGDTAVYVRNADGVVIDNDISAIDNHGVTVVGDADGVTVAGNVIAGSGTQAIAQSQAVGFTPGENDLEGWQPAATPESVLRSAFQPLTIVWTLLALLLLATTIGPRSMRFGTFRHPYAERVPLQSMTRGVVARHSIDRGSE